LSQYQSTPFKPQPALLTAGKPEYVFGSYNDRTPDTRLVVTSVACTGNVATLGVTVLEGNIPAIGSLITVQGTASAAGVYNVTNAALTAVNITASTGVGTVSFALTTANLATSTDGGIADTPQPEVGETIGASAGTAAGYASVPVAKPFNNPNIDQSEVIMVAVSFPVLPKACSVVLEEALIDRDTEYSAVATVANVSNSVAGGSVVTPTAIEVSGKFYRLKVYGLVGTGTIVGKILG
jgi:hypothetical protein